MKRASISAVLLLGACLPAPEEPAVAIDPPPGRAHQAHAQPTTAGIPASERERDWTRLRAWLQGPANRHPVVRQTNP
jgi:hypothetical protein